MGGRMGGRNRREVPARLLRLEERFAAWRTTRAVGERIPASLWMSAAKLAADHGLNQTAKVLKLDYYSLKKHVERQSPDSRSKVAFVELPSAPVSPASECLIELENGPGASMRIHLKGTQVPDVLALSRVFWRAG